MNELSRKDKIVYTLFGIWLVVIVPLLIVAIVVGGSR